MPDACHKCDQPAEHFLLVSGGEVALCCDCYRVSSWYMPGICAHEHNEHKELAN